MDHDCPPGIEREKAIQRGIDVSEWVERDTNAILEQKAITDSDGKYTIDYERIPAVIGELAKELADDGSRRRSRPRRGLVQALRPDVRIAHRGVEGGEGGAGGPSP
jgi:hypothetical protein